MANKKNNKAEMISAVLNKLAKAKTVEPATDQLQQLIRESTGVLRECESPLDIIKRETELSAVDIISQVRNLDTTAQELLKHLGSTDLNVEHLQSEIRSNTEEIKGKITSINDLSNRLEEDQQTIQALTNEIRSLTSMTSLIKELSRQTTMLSLNAAVEAAKAGELGRGFTVVANEVKKLAQQSNDAAEEIGKRIANAQAVIDDTFSCEVRKQTSEEIEKAKSVVGFVADLHNSYEGMQRFYIQLLTVSTENSKKMAADIVDMLGSVQYQDLVRQRVERVQSVHDDLEQILCHVAEKMNSTNFDVSEECAKVLALKNTLLEEERRHNRYDAASLGTDDNADQPPKIQLF